MRLRPAIALILAMASLPAMAKRSAQPGFAEPSDIIAAESYFKHVSAAKGLKAAIKATAAPDALIFAPVPMRVSDYADRATPVNFPSWHTGQVWMSCDGSIGVAHGTWQQGEATAWYITVWKRQKGGGYKWVLEQGGPQTAAHAASAESDMILASVADCPLRRAPASAPAPDRGKAPPADYISGHADDATLAWATTLAADGHRSFTLQIQQNSALHEVLRAAAPGA